MGILMFVLPSSCLRTFQTREGCTGLAITKKYRRALKSCRHVVQRDDVASSHIRHCCFLRMRYFRKKFWKCVKNAKSEGVQLPSNGAGKEVHMLAVIGNGDSKIMVKDGLYLCVYNIHVFEGWECLYQHNRVKKKQFTDDGARVRVL